MSRDEPNKQLSLRDIAAEAGVSISTVSRVLSGEKNGAKISDETRKRILEVCEEKRFRPNIHYRRLHEGMSRVIAFLIPPPDNQLMFFDETVGVFLSALEPCLAHHGFHIMIQSTTPAFLADRKHLDNFRSHAVDGAILWDVFPDDDHLAELMEEGKPLLKVAFSSQNLLDQILPDNYRASYNLTDHLLELGHTHIAHSSGGFSPVEKERVRGYEDAMANAGAKPLLIPAKYTYSSGYRLAELVTQKHPEVTALMAPNDVAAAGCIRRLKELGISVPGQISVTGFDGTSHSEVSDPKITTADLRLDKIGRLAADRIVKAILSPAEYSPRVTKVEIPVIIRESTGPAPLVKTEKKEKRRHV